MVYRKLIRFTLKRTSWNEINIKNPIYSEPCQPYMVCFAICWEILTKIQTTTRAGFTITFTWTVRADVCFNNSLATGIEILNNFRRKYDDSNLWRCLRKTLSVVFVKKVLENRLGDIPGDIGQCLNDASVISVLEEMLKAALIVNSFEECRKSFSIIINK